MTDINAYSGWPTNADLIHDVAELYLPRLANVLDTTYGLGTWWNKVLTLSEDPYTDRCVYANDIDPSKGDIHYDVRELPESWLHRFDVVAFDPPYKLNGTPSPGEDRYGIHGYVSAAERNKLLAIGARKCAGCVKPGGTLWVKCADQVAGGKVHWQTQIAMDATTWTGLELVDRFDMVRTPRPQPAGRKQIHARRNGSTLLVFKRMQ